MEIDSTLAWVAWAISVAGFTLASLGEASLASVRPERVQWLVAQRVPRAAALEVLFSTPMSPGGSLLLLKVLFLASSLLSISTLLSRLGSITLVALAVLSLLGLINTAARAMAAVYGERIALRIAVVVRRLELFLKPFLAAEAFVVHRLLEANADEADPANDVGSPGSRFSSDAELEPLDEREARMIRGVVRLDKTTAREIMVPSVDIVAAETGTSLDRLAEMMVNSGHSRIPIFQGSLDHVQGIVYARDIVGYLSRSSEASEALNPSIIRPARFIPETKTLEELLNEFQGEQVHIAIVIDEYGGVSGLVTIEDLLEEIVGEIEDEFDVGEPEIQLVGDAEFLMDARVSIDQLNELLDVVIEGEGFDTIGGFVYQRLGKIPSSGDSVDYDGFRIEVVSTLGRRLKKLRVTRQE